VHGETLHGGSGNLLVERGFQPTRRYARMAFGVYADADLGDAGFAQPAALDDRERVDERPRGIEVAADHQEATHVRLAAQPSQQTL